MSINIQVEKGKIEPKIHLETVPALKVINNGIPERQVKDIYVEMKFENIYSYGAAKTAVNTQDKGAILDGKLINIHDEAHSLRVMNIAVHVSKGLGFSENHRVIRLLKIATYLHDIGNNYGRHGHAEMGGEMSKEILLKRSFDMLNKDKALRKELIALGVGYDEYTNLYEACYKNNIFRKLNKEERLKVNKLRKMFNDIRTVEWAIGNHSEVNNILSLGKLPNGLNKKHARDVAIGVFLGDKLDIGPGRVRHGGEVDMHVRVNDNLRAEKSLEIPKIRITEKSVKVHFKTNNKKLAAYYGIHKNKPQVGKYIDEIMSVYMKQFARVNAYLLEAYGRKLEVYVNNIRANRTFLKDYNVVTGLLYKVKSI